MEGERLRTEATKSVQQRLCWLRWTSVLDNRPFENDIPFLHRLQKMSGKGKIMSRQAISCSSNDILLFEGEAFLVVRVLPHLLQLRRHCLDILYTCFLSST
jgi:hypothetical protein